MAPTSSTRCGNCAKDAKMRCSGCNNAPEYQSGDANIIVYCNSDCQKEHWPKHKPDCRTLGEREKLLRTAMILKAALLEYRQSVYDIDLKKIEFKDGTLYLYQNPTVSANWTPGPFPIGLTTDMEHESAALVHNQCTAAMALSSGLSKKLLDGLVSTIEVVDLKIGKPLFTTKLVPGRSTSITPPHTVLKVRGRLSKETWIIDPAGSQYGFQDVLIPYDKYISEKSCQVVGKPTNYDWTETKDLDFFATLSRTSGTQQQRENLKRERQARLKFAAFVSQIEEDILKGSATEFMGKCYQFSSKLKFHMVLGCSLR